jgi:hypothetical protein
VFVTASTASAQVEGADFRFQERMRGVVEYMQFREMPSDIKRKASSAKHTRAHTYKRIDDDNLSHHFREYKLE